MKRLSYAGVRKSQKGSSLIEVMIAIFVISVGMLGVAGLQLKTMANNQSQLSRSTVVIYGYIMLENLRVASKSDLTSGAYNFDGCQSTLSGTEPATLTSWLTSVKSDPALGDNACGAVTCSADSDSFLCKVTVSWQDVLTSDTGVLEKVVTEARL